MANAVGSSPWSAWRFATVMVDIIKLEIDVSDERPEAGIDTLLRGARSGDGKIYVSEIRRTVDIAAGRVL